MVEIVVGGIPMIFAIYFFCKRASSNIRPPQGAPAFNRLPRTAAYVEKIVPCVDCGFLLKSLRR